LAILHGVGLFEYVLNRTRAPTASAKSLQMRRRFRIASARNCSSVLLLLKTCMFVMPSA